MIYSDFIIIFIGLSFIFYSFNALFSNKMKYEYHRWGFSEYRVIISCVQLLCALCLLLGLLYSFFLIYCTIIFFLMMLGAICVRFKTKDSFLEMLPALMYLVLNGMIIYMELFCY